MTRPQDEFFDLIDDASGEVVGCASRADCHGNPALLHRAVHVVVFHPDGRILLQKRAASKDIQPGKWDTAVGGHLACGETPDQAARRELREELGICPPEPFEFLFSSKVRNEMESENISVFSCLSTGPFHIQTTELDEVRFFSPDELRNAVRAQNPPDFTPALCDELRTLLFRDRP